MNSSQSTRFYDGKIINLDEVVAMEVQRHPTSGCFHCAFHVRNVEKILATLDAAEVAAILARTLEGEQLAKAMERLRLEGRVRG